MRIYISAKDENVSEYPKQLFVYCNGKLESSLDLVENNIINIDDDVSRVKIACKSYSRKNGVSAILFFLIALVSMIFGTNGSEVFDYIFDDIIELEGLEEDIYIRYFSSDIEPFLIYKGVTNIIQNHRTVEKTVFNTWIFAVIIPIEIILVSITTILIIASKYIWFNVIMILLLVGFEIYILNKVKKAYSFVKKKFS